MLPRIPGFYFTKPDKGWILRTALAIRPPTMRRTLTDEQRNPRLAQDIFTQENPRSVQPGRQDDLHRPAHAVLVQVSRPHHRDRPFPGAARRGGKDPDRSARPALPARPPDRDPRRAGGRARRRRVVAGL